MNKITRIVARGAMALLVMAVPKSAEAVCPNPTPMQHGFGSNFASCPDQGPVEA